jgi:hypothetical protein
MEMHQLRYFVAVARTGTFNRAAGECRVAQPSLSQQIQKLESEVGALRADPAPSDSHSRWCVPFAACAEYP